MAVNHQVLHSLHDVVLVEVWILLRVLVVKVLQEGGIRQLISLLVVLVILRVHLEAVVREMNELVHLRERVFVGARPQVAGLVEVEVLLLVDQREDADVELPAIEEQGSLDVLLYDDSFALGSHDVADQLLPRADDFDTSATVLVLWLDNPNVLCQLSGRQPAIGVIVLCESPEVRSHFCQLRIL